MSTHKLNFLQYLDSKKQLLESIKRDPIVVYSYTITKYCKLAVGSNLCEEKQYIDLKPKCEIDVVWRYDNTTKDVDIHEMQRHPLKIKIIDEDNVIEYDLSHKDEKLTKWLSTNAKEN
jgi:hypothetical protein